MTELMMMAFGVYSLIDKAYAKVYGAFGFKRIARLCELSSKGHMALAKDALESELGDLDFPAAASEILEVEADLLDDLVGMIPIGWIPGSRADLCDFASMFRGVAESIKVGDTKVGGLSDFTESLDEALNHTYRRLENQPSEDEDSVPSYGALSLEDAAKAMYS